MLGLKFIARVLKELSRGASPNQLAAGFVFGALLGLIPGWPLHAVVLLLLLLLFNTNLSMALLGAALASALAWLADPWLHALGRWLLVDQTTLRGLWTALYNNPLLALTHFNNTLVMGATVGGLVLTLPLFFVVRLLVRGYRTRLLAAVSRFKLVQILKGSHLYTLYQRLAN